MQHAHIRSAFNDLIEKRVKVDSIDIKETLNKHPTITVGMGEDEGLGVLGLLNGCIGDPAVRLAGVYDEEWKLIAFDLKRNGEPAPPKDEKVDVRHFEVKEDGRELMATIWYPQRTEEPKYVHLDMMHTRAADGIRIHYDMDRNGWVISKELWNTVDVGMGDSFPACRDPREWGDLVFIPNEFDVDGHEVHVSGLPLPILHHVVKTEKPADWIKINLHIGDETDG